MGTGFDREDPVAHLSLITSNTETGAFEINGSLQSSVLIMQLRTFCYVEQSLLVLTLRTELIFHEFIVL